MSHRKVRLKVGRSEKVYGAVARQAELQLQRVEAALRESSAALSSTIREREQLNHFMKRTVEFLEQLQERSAEGGEVDLGKVKRLSGYSASQIELGSQVKKRLAALSREEVVRELALRAHLQEHATRRRRKEEAERRIQRIRAVKLATRESSEG